MEKKVDFSHRIGTIFSLQKETLENINKNRIILQKPTEVQDKLHEEKSLLILQVW